LLEPVIEKPTQSKITFGAVILKHVPDELEIFVESK